MLSLMGSVGRVGIVAEPDCLLNHRVAVLVSVRKDTLTGFFFWFWQTAFKEHMIGIAQGTAQSNLSALKNYSWRYPIIPVPFRHFART